MQHISFFAFCFDGGGVSERMGEIMAGRGGQREWEREENLKQAPPQVQSRGWGERKLISGP